MSEPSLHRLAGALAIALLASLAACGRQGRGPAAAPAAPPALEAAPGEVAAPAAPAAGRPDLAETLRRDLDDARDPGDGGGRAWIESQEPMVIRAGERGRFTLVYEAGPLGIAPGGMVLLQVSPFWGWTTPQVENPS